MKEKKKRRKKKKKTKKKRGELRRPSFYSRRSRRWFRGEPGTFLAFAVGEVILSSGRLAGSRLILGGLILCGSRQIPGWFLACSRPKRQPTLFQDGERDSQIGQDIFKICQKGDLDDPKKSPRSVPSEISKWDK